MLKINYISFSKKDSYDKIMTYNDNNDVLMYKLTWLSQ